MSIKTLLHHLKKTEKIVLAFLIILLVFSTYRIGKAFYLENTEADFVSGGVYVEGAVGTVDSINPLFIQQGSVGQDLSELIFSGLTKYDTQTGEIIGDLANVKADEGGKKYTFVLKENALWHDGKPVRADDVIFTYEGVIKNPGFKGNILAYNDYSGIRATKVDDRTVEFLLEKPDAFFLVKTMVGLLPKHLLENEPVEFLETAPFNFNPIGSGPYRFVSQVNLPDHTEYGLESYDQYYGGEANIKSILLKVFPTFDDLKGNLNDLDGIRSIPGEETDNILKKDKFALDVYQLPQYVAIFINNEAEKLKEVNVRLGLQLGTDKQAIIEAIGEKKIIDTPLLEIDQTDWRHQYSVKRANGALVETQWQIPNKDEVLAKMKEGVQEANAQEAGPTAQVTYINGPNGGRDWKTGNEPITITGTAPKETVSITVNDYPLQKYKPGDSGWSYTAAKKFDSLKEGENVYEVYAENLEGEKTMIDAITIHFGDQEKLDEGDKEQLMKENAEAIILPTRENKKGEKLSLKLVTSSQPPTYSQVANLIKEQWQKIGVEVDIQVLEGVAFQEAVSNRNYDLLLFGQNLGYNLDAYPYWHTSQASKEGSRGGLNLSQFKNFVADSLLQEARLDDDDARQKTLKDLQDLLRQEVPAIFLYSPTYHSAISKNIHHPEFKFLATTSDRLSDVIQWYSKVDRKFKDGVNPFTFFAWLVQQF